MLGLVSNYQDRKSLRVQNSTRTDGACHPSKAHFVLSNVGHLFIGFHGPEAQMGNVPNTPAGHPAPFAFRSDPVFIPLFSGCKSWYKH